MSWYNRKNFSCQRVIYHLASTIGNQLTVTASSRWRPADLASPRTHQRKTLRRSYYFTYFSIRAEFCLHIAQNSLHFNISSFHAPDYLKILILISLSTRKCLSVTLSEFLCAFQRRPGAPLSFNFLSLFIYSLNSKDGYRLLRTYFGNKIAGAKKPALLRFYPLFCSHGRMNNLSWKISRNIICDNVVAFY